MSERNEFGYVGEVLCCRECGEAVIKCRGECWLILKCNEDNHVVQQKYGKQPSHTIKKEPKK